MAQDRFEFAESFAQNVNKSSSSTSELHFKNGNRVNDEEVENERRRNVDLLDEFNEYEEPRSPKFKTDLSSRNPDLENNTHIKGIDSLDEDLWAPSGRVPRRKNSTSSIKSMFQFQRNSSERYDLEDSPQFPHQKTFLHKIRNTQRRSSSGARFMFGTFGRSRSQSGSQNLLTSPIDIVKNFGCGRNSNDYASYLEENDTFNASSFNSTTSHFNNLNGNNKDDCERTSSRKWFSFSNLWSHRQNLTNILAMPKSRLSVTSLFTPTFNGETNDSSSSNDITPTEGKNYAFCKPEPSSPTPSCATISGDFPYSMRTQDLSMRSPGTSSSVIYRRRGQRSTNQRSASATVGDTSPSRPYPKPSGNSYRFSCGEFFPSGGAASSTGHLRPDFQFNIYPSTNTKNDFNKSGFADDNGRTNNFRGGSVNVGYNVMKSPSFIGASKEYGRSLPTLLEAMECASYSNTGHGGRTDPQTVTSVAELIYEEYAIFTGAKTIDDHYILILPDRTNFHTLGETDYRRLMGYLASVPTKIQDAESGFVIIVDRRNDKWNSVKTALLRISAYFPATIHRVFVLRPVGFLQKALSEVSTKLFRIENLRFRLTVCNNVSDLQTYVDTTQLPSELGGLLLYEKVKWVQERVEIESFQMALQTLSKCLKRFTESFHDIEYPNDVISTEKFIRNKEEEYNRLRNDLSEAGNHGEKLLLRLKNCETAGVSRIDLTREQGDIALNNRRSGTQLVNVVSIEGLILQIDETQKLFVQFWSKEKHELENYLELRKFEHEFRELQSAFDVNMKCLNGIPEMGDDLKLSDALIADTLNFQELISTDLEMATTLEQAGRSIVNANPAATDIVEPKCVELSRITTNFKCNLQEKIIKQRQWREVQTTIEKANKVCTEGIDLVTEQQITESTQEPSWSEMTTEIDSYLVRLENHLESLQTFKNNISNCGNNVANQSKVLVKQIIKRMEEVQEMCIKRQAFISQQRDKIQPSKGKRRIHSGPSWGKSVDLKSFKTQLPQQQSSSDTGGFSDSMDGSCLSSLSSNGASEYVKETCDVRRGHILRELLETEKSYVNEIGLILNGYRDVAQNSDISHMGVALPSQLVAEDKPCPVKISVLFCNLDEIYSFHSKLFLPDLENCIQSIELVGLCFIQRHSDFLAIYSEYCQLMPSSETLIKEIGKTHPWFLKCQEKLGQQLPLSSYLLKPVQRITKFHLLLRDLVKNSAHCEGYTEIAEALECMLIVLRSVNDGMHQLAIRGYPTKLPDEGSLLLQGPFTIWMESGKSRLRLKGHQRYLFLYQKSILMCKKIGTGNNVSYEFKNKINMSEIGMTEALKGSASTKKFEIWIQGREQVYVLQAETPEMKEIWVKAIKNLLMEQLESLRVRFDLKNSVPIACT